jgi:glycosyltransferase involved in cell wall biosynthesis
MAKVLVVGHTPPPHLGLSIMLDSIVRSKMRDVELRHVRMEFSSNESQVGKFRWAKIFRLFPLLIRIFYARIVYGPQILYYAPAGATRFSVFRDIAILGATRFLFPKIILHFHAGGHGELYKTLPRWQQWLFRRAFFGVAGAVRISEFTPEDAKNLHAVREYIVTNGIADIAEDMPLPRPALPVSNDRPLRVLFVALLCEGKGLLDLLKAVGELVGRNVPVQLDVMGRFESPEFETRVRHLIAELKIEDRVHFLGVLTGEKKLDAFHQSDVLCHPTFFDTFGLVIVEAMACSRPVVATRWASIPTIVDEGQTGLLVEPHDPIAVANCLEELAENPQLRQKMGEAGRAKFLREFTLPKHIERVREVFLDVAGEAPCPKNTESYEDWRAMENVPASSQA